MMKQRLSLSLLSVVAAFLPCARSAPALVWSNTRQQSASSVHSSGEISARDLIHRVLSESSETEQDALLDCAVFFLGRSKEDADGKGYESLNKLADEGKLPKIAAIYDSMDPEDASPEIFHFVSGFDTPETLARAAASSSSAKKGSGAPVVVSLDEYERKLSGGDDLAAIAPNRRMKDIDGARVMVVKVDPIDAHRLDGAVASAVGNARIGSVVLAAQRSTDEVKHERNQYYRQLQQRQQEHPTSRKLASNSRRLEDENQDGEGDNNNQNGNNNNNNQDMSGVYYVSMTPNIFAGILFTFMFATVTWIAIGCMGMIQGQDVYVKKMPHIGREA